MARNENFEKDWFKIEQELIYSEKALNTGVFGGGFYYDFYQEKEAKSAESFLMNEPIHEVIDKISILKVNHEISDLFRLTVVINNDKIEEFYSKTK